MNDTANRTSLVLPEWVFYEQIVFSGTIALIGIPGNILVIIVLAYSRGKTTTDYMVFSMASSDLLGSIFCTSFTILRNIPVVLVRIGAHWFCLLNEYFSILTASCSIWLLSAIAIDRYMKTCRPHSGVFTISRAKWMCIGICTVVAMLSWPAALAARFDLSGGVCLVNGDNEWIIGVQVIGACNCLSFLATAIAYLLVAFALCKRLKEKIRRRRAVWRSQNTVTVQFDGSDKNFEQKFEDKSDLSEPRSISTDVNQVSVVEKTQNENEKSRKAGKDEVLRLEHRRVNRTTVIMFLITAINSLTFILLMTGYALVEESDNNLGVAIGYITQTSYMVNYIANPILYMSMSSKFRGSVRKLFQRQ